MLANTESITAKICAFVRAYHSNLSDNKIYDDYLAFDLLGRDEYEVIKSMVFRGFSSVGEKGQYDSEQIHKNIAKYMAPIPLSRINFAENKLNSFSQKHGECQYVVCGAGLDTFAFRNTNPHIKIFEIDHPSTQAYKKQRIEELGWNIPANTNLVSVDFEKDSLESSLINRGFSKDKKTFFSVLGVSYYLTLSTFVDMIRNIAKLSSDESMLVLDFPDRSTLKSKVERVRKMTQFTEEIGENMQSGFSPIDIIGILKDHDFIVETYMNPSKIQKIYFENCDDRYKAFENVHFISAVFKK